MVDYDTLLLKYEQLIQEQFKVKNPYLLKTGTLGTLINIFANQEMDLFNYYNKLFQETHPALAQDFNSMLFHSNFYDVPINFAQPARFPVYLQIPQINTEDVYYYEYTIPENTEFRDENGYEYIIPDKIEVFQDKSNVKAYAYIKNEGKVTLNIIETPINNGVVYLIEYNNVRQYSRNFYSNIIGEYNVGESAYFDIPIEDYRKINKIQAWANLNNAPIDTNKLKDYYSSDIAKIFNLQPLDIKFFDFDSNKFSYDLFVDIKKTLLSFKTGNGIKGIKLPVNSQVLVEIDLTNGANANSKHINIFLNNIMVKKVTLDKKESFFKTNISLFSITGGIEGKNFESIESIRNKIFNQIQIRHSLITESDYEKAFEYNGIKPFVDSKFLNTNSIIFLYNPFKYNDKTIQTLANNISEIDLSEDPFYPIWTPNPENGKTFISPFYYKRKNNNIVDAYIVIPKIHVPLYTSQTQDRVKVVDNEISLSIEYNFNTRKSYLRLKNTKDKYTYKLICNYFSHTFTFGENFQWEVDNIYTDKYCIIKEPLFDFKVNIYNEKGEFVMAWQNKVKDSVFFQLKKKQEINKYYKKQENDITLNDAKNTVATEYLDNQLEEIISEVEQLYYPIQYNEIPTLLRVPFIDKEFFDTIDYNELYPILDAYFQVQENEKLIPLTTKVQQSFYNTYDYETPLFTNYTKYIFKESSNIINKPKIPITINITIDQEIFKISNYTNTYDLEFDIKIKVTDFLLKKEGFQIDFFESELESHIIQSYINTDIGRSIIKNIDVLSPKKFIINDSDTIYYNIKKELGFDYLMNFVPPYFYYDYDNMVINITAI